MNQVSIDEIQDLPGDLAKRMNVSSIVLSTADSAPGIIERATAIAPFESRFMAPGCVFSRFVRWTSSQTRYLWISGGIHICYFNYFEYCHLSALFRLISGYAVVNDEGTWSLCENNP